MKIKTKLRIIAILPVFVFVTATVIQYVAYREINILHINEQLGYGLSRATSNLINLTYEYQDTHGERAAAQWGKQYDDAGRFLQDMAAAVKKSEEKSLIKEIRLMHQKAGKLFAEIRAYENSMNFDGTTKQSAVLRNNMLNRLILELQSIEPLAENLHDKNTQAIQQTLRYVSLLTIGIVLAMALCILSLSFLIIKRIARSFDQLQKGIQAIADGDLDYRVNLRTPDEIGFLARGFDEMIVKLGAVTVSRDALTQEIAQRKKVQDALAASEAQLKDAQRIALMGSWMLDLTTNTLVWSDEIYRIFEIDPKIFGATYEAFLNAIHPDDRDKVNKAYTDSLISKSPYEIDHRLLMQDGRIKYVHEQCETVFNAEGNPLRSLGTVQDITARKLAEDELRKLNEELEQRVAMRTRDLEKKTIEIQEAQRALVNIVEDLNHKTEELEKANRAKSVFLANMSHEIRTPMNAILGFTDLLSALLYDDRQKSYLNAIKISSKNLLTLINDILDLSKIEAGKLKILYEPVNAHSIFNEIGQIFSLRISEKKLEFITEVSTDIPESLLLDEVRLRQILFNLIGNSVKFTEKGYIKVSATRIYTDDEQSKIDLTISVEDTGIGIPKESQSIIFESFRQQNGQDDRKYGGAGLGLAIVKRLVEMMNGEITLKSEPGKGSIFEITLHNVAVAGTVAKTADDKPVEAEKFIFDPAVILAVDDVESNRFLIKEYFEHSNIHVIESEDGLQAISAVEQYKPDIILMDISMPVMDGYEATHLIKKNEHLKHIPVIALTARASQHDKDRILSSGFDGYLAKPVKRTDLFNELSRFIPYSVKEKTPDRPCLSETETLLPETVNKLPDIVKRLETEFIQTWENVRKKKKFDDIADFAGQLKRFGEEHSINSLITFGKDLMSHCNNFDIVNIESSLNSYPEVIEKIKALGSETEGGKFSCTKL